MNQSTDHHDKCDMWGKLTIIDSESWIYVASDKNPEDWVARFEKTEDFPALEWAERMVALYDVHVQRCCHWQPLHDLSLHDDRTLTVSCSAVQSEGVQF